METNETWVAPWMASVDVGEIVDSASLLFIYTVYFILEAVAYVNAEHSLLRVLRPLMQ